MLNTPENVSSGTHAAATDVFYKQNGGWQHIIPQVTLVSPE